MKRHLTLGLLLGAISMALGTFAGIKTFSNTKVSDAQAVTYYDLSSNIHASYTTFTHYLWSKAGSAPNYNPETNTGGFNVNDSYCTQGSSNSYVISYFNEYPDAATPYIEIGPKAKQDTYAYAFYAPLYIKYTMPARTVIHDEQILNVELQGDGTAIKSAEMFYFNFSHSTSENMYHPNKFWYIRGDTTTTDTGMPYSIGRVSSKKSGTKTGEFSFQMDYQNYGNKDVDVYFHLGLFTYMEAPGSPSQSFRCRVSGESSQSRTSLVSVNNRMYIDFNEAVDAYNAAPNSSMSFEDNVNLANDITLSSTNGSVLMNGYTLNCGTYGVTFADSTSLTNGTITGSTDTLLTVDTPNINIDFDSNFTINHSGLTTINMAENAVGSFVSLKATNTITNTITNTNTNTAATIVSLNAGSFVLAGSLVSSSTTQDSIRYGTGTPSKSFYICGNGSVNGCINVHSDTDSSISARYYSDLYTGTNNVKIKTSGSWNDNSTLVIGVVNNNYEKFVLAQDYYELVRSGARILISGIHYDCEFYLTNVTKTSGETYGTYNDSWTYEFTANEGYILPDTITVRIAGSVVEQNTAYTYIANGNIGIVKMNKNMITSSFTISIVATEGYVVSFLNPDGSIAADSIGVIPNGQVTFPSPVYNLPKYRTFNVWTRNSDGSGFYYYSGSQTTITADTTFYAAYYRSDDNILDEFQDIQLHFDVNVIDENNNTDTGACKTSGYYVSAKEVYNTFTYALKRMFNTNSNYAKGRARLEAWARANGETIDTSNYQLVPLNANPVIKVVNERNMFILIAVVTFMISITGFALIVLKKKRGLTK